MNITITLVLIDDHTLLRQGIRALLTAYGGFEIIGEAADGRTGAALAERLHPDVVLLDLEMPDMDGKKTLAEILRTHPGQAVVMLAASGSGNDLTECMSLGARGFLLKNSDADFLAAAIRKAAAGENVFSPEMTALLVQSLISPVFPTRDLLRSLTARELEILGCLAAGYSNKTISQRLDLAEATVKVHMQNILRKLKLESRLQAAVYAIRHNIPQPPQP